MAAALRILFVSMTDDVGSDRIVGEIGRLGGACAVLGPRGCFAGLPRAVSARFELPGAVLGPLGSTWTLRTRFGAAVAAWSPDRVVPLDELSALSLRTLAADRKTPPSLRDLLVTSLGRLEGYEASCHRLPLMTVAAACGIRVPDFSDAEDRRAAVLPLPVFVKRDHSSGSGGVVRVETAAELAAALRRARTKQSIKRVMAQAAGFRHGRSPILLQRQVPGALAMRTVVCREGVVLDGISLLATAVHPTKGSSTRLEAIDSTEMTDAARILVAALGCSGFVSFDFIVDARGRAFLIEMNPRPVGSTHLGRLFGHDLGRAFMADAPVPAGPDALAVGTTVALFPKELERDLESPCLDPASGIHHDLPRDEPEVVEAYIRLLAKDSPAVAAQLRCQFGLRPAAVPTAPAWAPRQLPQVSP